jgi:hypothetical protein
MERKREFSWLKNFCVFTLCGGCIFAGFLLGMLIFLNWEKKSRRRDFPHGADPASCSAVLSFRDYLGVYWVNTPDGGAMHADSDLVPDIVKALEAAASGNGAPSPHVGSQASPA